MRRTALIVALVAALLFGAVRPADAGVKHALKRFTHGAGEVIAIALVAVIVVLSCAGGGGCAFQDQK